MMARLALAQPTRFRDSSPGSASADAGDEGMTSDTGRWRHPDRRRDV
jgi:hypothetical protein